MSSSIRAAITFTIAVVIGFAIAYIDTRPNWDDTGITAGALFLGAAILSAARPKGFWITGLAVGLPVLVLNALLRANYGSAIAVIVALAGAGAGAWVGTLINS